ncbi:MAG TPA: hypothetical protein DIC19_05115 [Erysipelotrichaceae bacterium]|nr:hypothetical protein [Erysipelotrichaceae bacterium]
MFDVFQVAELLVDNVKEKYENEVCIVAYYGSCATGEATDTSDLDMFYIPDDGKSVPLYASFTFKELPFEFWPVTWKFAESIALGKQSYAVAPALIANAKILYSRSETDLKRFTSLQEDIIDMQKPEHKSILLKEALEIYKTVPFHFEKLVRSIRISDVSSIRVSALEFLNVSIDCLSLINQTYFDRAWWVNSEKLLRLEKRPLNLLELVRTISVSNDFEMIENAAQSLKDNIRELLVTEQKHIDDDHTFQDVFSGYYPGVVEYVNKILSACKKMDDIAVFAAATTLQKEISLMLSKSFDKGDFSSFNIYNEYRNSFDEHDLPDISSNILRGDFGSMLDQIKRLEVQMRMLFEGNQVSLNRFDEISELSRFIKENTEA